MTPQEIKDFVIEALQDKQAVDLTVIDVEKMTSIAEFFVIASGRNSIQVKAMAEHVEEKLEERELRPSRIDGLSDARWVVMDYGGVLVHIFNDSTRDFFNLELLWAKGDNITKIV